MFLLSLFTVLFSQSSVSISGEDLKVGNPSEMAEATYLAELQRDWTAPELVLATINGAPAAAFRAVGEEKGL
jgi:hypothetical protein